MYKLHEFHMQMQLVPRANYKTYTAGGNIRAASLETACQWVKDSWEKIGEDMIKYSFKKCGISNLLNSCEDDVLWRDGDGEASDKVADEMDDVDLYDDMNGADGGIIW